MPEQDKGKFHDELSRIMSGMSEEDLVDRIKMCQEVCDKLESDPIWQVVLRDTSMWVEKLNATWQEVYDEKQLAGLRVLKLAYTHLASLPNKYKEDLLAAQQALDNMRNTDTTIQRDYDNDTNLEEAA